ncbi:MAG: beta strand repeat-containing protein, partial [Waterburya sp.]
GNAGTIDINATGDITITGQSSDSFFSGFGSAVDPNAVGDAGGITIATTNLNLINGGSIFANTSAQGNSGTVDITATGDITVAGEDSNRVSSGIYIYSSVNSGGVGDAGEIKIFTKNLTLTNGGIIDASTFGEGNAGIVDITATGDITFDGQSSDGFSSGIFNSVDPDGVGNAGGITISTTNLNLTNGGQIDASTFGEGNAGTIDINATGDIAIDGISSDGFSSGIFSIVKSNAVGNAGGINISSTNLNLSNGGTVDASTFGKGNAGTVDITATGDIAIDGQPSGAIFSNVGSEAIGDAGGITISTTNLNLTNGGEIISDTSGKGNGGTVDIIATGDIIITGDSSMGFSSGIFTGVESNGVGNAGEITISTTNLNLTDGGEVLADTFGEGNAGTIDVNATGDITIAGESSDGFSSGIFSSVQSNGVGNAGGITISTSKLNLTNGGQVIADTFGKGNGGNILVNASELITINGTTLDGEISTEISTEVVEEAIGNSGSIKITTPNLFISDSAVIDASTFGDGNGGNVEIQSELLELNNNASISSTATSGLGGNANIQADTIILDKNSNIRVGALEDANGGNINIDAGFIVAFPSQAPRSGNDIIANSVGSGGNINIQV